MAFCEDKPIVGVNDSWYLMERVDLSKFFPVLLRQETGTSFFKILISTISWGMEAARQSANTDLDGCDA